MIELSRPEDGTQPAPTECLVCYVDRMVSTNGCDTSLRWAQRFRRLRSPTATGLERRIDGVGADCDCELSRSGFRLVRELLVRDLRTDELEPPPERPTCAGVGRTSTRPCANWERVRRR